MRNIEIKVVKFTNGDNIICTIDTEHYIIDNNLIVTNPVQIETEQYYEGDSLVESMIMKPWMPLSDDKIFIIHLDKVLCISNANGVSIKKYSDFTKAYKEESKKTSYTNNEIVTSRTLH